MEERGFEALLEQILEEFMDDHPSQVDGNSDEEYQISRIAPFEAAGIVTIDRGIVVGMRDGREFQLTIKRSK